MYNETLKFQFNEDVSNSKRLAYIAELFTELEAQKKEYKHLASGGVPSYKIKGNGKIILNSYFSPSTAIIRQFIKSRRKENILK